MSEAGQDPTEDPTAQEHASRWKSYVDDFHRLARRTQNPLYAWLALEAQEHAVRGSRSGTPLETDLPMPAWCAEYLLTVAERLALLRVGLDFRTMPTEPGEEAFARWSARRLSADEAMKLVPLALGLTRSGWNAFAAMEATTAKMADYHEYAELRASGMRAGEALTILMDKAGIQEQPSMRKRLAEGRRLTCKEEGSEPTG